MIRHLVLFKLNDGVGRDEPRVVAGAKAFRELADQIPELEFWECAWNITDRPIAYDFAVNSAVADTDASSAISNTRPIRPPPGSGASSPPG